MAVKYLIFLVMGIFLSVFGMSYSVEAQDERSSGGQFIMYSVGKIERTVGHTRVIIESKYQPALLGLEGFSHAYILYWFDRNDTPQKRSILQVYPRGDKRNPLSGVFATRSPMRPNLIGFSLCKILSVHENIIEIDEIDAFDNTPVLDIKPYLPFNDAAEEACLPEWLEER